MNFKLLTFTTPSWILVVVFSLCMTDQCCSQTPKFSVASVIKAWSKYEREAFANVEFSTTASTGKPSGDDGQQFTGKVRTFERVASARNGNIKMVSSDGKRVKCANRYYSFSLSRRGDDWYVDEIDTTLDRNENSFLAIGEVHLADLFGSDNFRVLDTSEETSDKLGKLVVVEFSCKYKIDSNNELLGGKVRLLADHNWLVWDYTAQQQSDDLGTISGRFQYHEYQSWLFPKTVVVDSQFPTGDIRHVFCCDVPLKCTLSDEAFRLPFYGLPEPKSLLGTGTRTWLYLVLLGALLSLSLWSWSKLKGS